MNANAFPEYGRVELSEIESAPHAILVRVEGVDSARILIEELELGGVPPGAIELVGGVTKEPRRDRGVEVPDKGAFGDVAKSTIIGGVLGTVIGAILGVVMSTVVPDLSWFWGAVMGGVFGGGVGGAAGGLSVTKFSSPAWDETYQVEDSSFIGVGVHHADREIVDLAEELSREHDEGDVSRFDNAP